MAVELTRTRWRVYGRTALDAWLLHCIQQRERVAVAALLTPRRRGIEYSTVPERVTSKVWAPRARSLIQHTEVFFFVSSMSAASTFYRENRSANTKDRKTDKFKRTRAGTESAKSGNCVTTNDTVDKHNEQNPPRNKSMSETVT